MIIQSQLSTKRINYKIRKYTAIGMRLMHRAILRHGRSEPEVQTAPNKSFFKGLVIALTATFLFGILLFSCARMAHADIVTIAKSQIGKGEIGGDNQGQIVEMYTRGKDVSWCAAFVSWTLSKAGSKGPYLLSAKSYWKVYQSKRVRSPRRGDIICFYRGSRRGHLGHVGIVEDVRGNRLITIEGNVGRFPARVKEFYYQLGHIPHLLGFVRVL